MEQQGQGQGGRGLWDLLFGVGDVDSECTQIKMEGNSNFQMDLSDDLLDFLGEPIHQDFDTQQSNVGLKARQDASSSTLMDILPASNGMDDLSACTGLDLEALGELSAYLELPSEFLATSSSSSGISSSCSDDGSVFSDNHSPQGSPKSTHSTHSSSSDSLHETGKEELLLSREELILLKKEGLSLPKSHPLTKAEERTLKKIRRKIRNKKSAQESRRKKKVYMDTLEDQVKDVTTQNKVLQKRVKELEKENVSLQQQLKTLQSIFGRATRNTKATGTCLMALVLSVALIVSPYTQTSATEGDKEIVRIGDYEVENVATVRSRIMYNLDSPPEPRLFGIPLAKDGFRIFKEDPSSLHPSKANSTPVIPGESYAVLNEKSVGSKEKISMIHTFSLNRTLAL